MLKRVSAKLILKFISGAPGAGAGGITALNHEIADYPMKRNPIIKAFVSQKDEVVYRIGGILRIQVKLNVASVRLNRNAVGLVRIDLHFRGTVPLLLGHIKFLSNLSVIHQERIVIIALAVIN
jgi:hypothetical protein